MIITSDELLSMSPLGLAHVGDAVYELLVRREVARRGSARVDDLHRKTVAFVSAPAQSRAAEKLLPFLTDAESAVFRRGRNCRSHASPHNATDAEYHNATGLEALFGWLYLREENDRIEQLFAAVLEE